MPLQHNDLMEDEIDNELTEETTEEIHAPEDLREPEEIALDREQAAAKLAKAASSLIAPVADPVDVAMLELRDAVMSGSVEAIGTAQKNLESARAEAMRKAQAAKDLNLATVEAGRLKSAKAAEARRKLADDVEARLRKRAPSISFQCPGNRVVTIKMGGTNLEPQVATEAIRRVAYAMNISLANQIAAGRQAGKSVPVADFLTPMITDEQGLAAAIKHGIAKITKGK